MTFDDWKELVPRLEADLEARAKGLTEGHDENAWRAAEELLRGYGRILLRSGGILRSEDAEDIVQETVLKLQSPQTMHRLRMAGSPAGYIAVMMKHAAIDHIRRRQREVPAIEPVEKGMYPAGPGDFDEQRLDAIERLNEILRGLEPEERNLLRMRFWMNMSIAEMADSLGISYSATAVRLFRTLKRMREAM